MTGSGLNLRATYSPIDEAALAERVAAGDVRALSRVITLLEDGEPMGRAVLQRLPADETHAAVIGVTGYPGAGKSTVIDQLVSAYRRQGKKVGVIAVDSSSPINGGAVLGDRIRMQDHSLDPGVYIRSMATRGHRGGVAGATDEAVQALQAAGYEVILIETVGVGQSEVDIIRSAQTVVAVVAPGLGDEIQAMKAGLLEVAHIVVVNKGDREGADMAVRDLQEWVPKVIRTVAVKGDGIAGLVEAIAEHQRIVDLQQTKPA
jgi:LAO/AO transport system kinase